MLNKNLGEFNRAITLLGSSAADPLKVMAAKQPDYMLIGYLTQTGTNPPVVKFLYNDLPVSISITTEYVMSGAYRLNCPLFTAHKTQAWVNPAQTNTPGTQQVDIFVDNGSLLIQSYNGGYVSLGDGILANTSFVVSIWNEDVVATPPAYVPPTYYYYYLIIPQLVGVSNLSGWTLDGISLTNQAALTTYMNGFGGEAATPIYSNFGFLNEAEGANFGIYTTAASLPTFTVLNNFGNDISYLYTWTPISLISTPLFCFQTTVSAANLDTYEVALGGHINNLNYTAGHASPLSLNWSVPADVSAFQTLLRNIYGPQVIVTSTINGGGDYVVQIKNVYTSSIDLFLGFGGIVTNTMSLISC